MFFFVIRSTQFSIGITWCSSSNRSRRNNSRKCVNAIWKHGCKQTLWTVDRRRIAVNRTTTRARWIPWHARRTISEPTTPTDPYWTTNLTKLSVFIIFTVTLDLQRTLARVIQVPNQCRLHWVVPHLWRILHQSNWRPNVVRWVRIRFYTFFIL